VHKVCLAGLLVYKVHKEFKEKQVTLEPKVTQVYKV
jgi:hypothetical protein